jgi:DNA primase
LILPNGEDPDTLIKRESVKSFSKRINDAQTLSSFLFDHIKAQVPFNTIEGKTLFLEKTAELINLVTYPTYRQQLIEGVAQEVGQKIDQVEKALAQNPPNERQVSEENMSWSDQSFQKKIIPSSVSSMKSLMSRMISCVINYPSIVNETESSSVIEERARRLPNSDVLVELIRYSQVETDLSKDALLMPYKSKPRIFSRLEELSVLEPFLSEYEAKEEFSYTLTAAEKFHERKSTKASISEAKTYEEQKVVMENIMKGKSNSNSSKKT